MSIGNVPASLRRSSNIVLAGEGGTVVELTRLMGMIVGPARVEDAELVRERISAENASKVSKPSEACLNFQRLEIVDMREPILERPLAETLSERLFLGEWGKSMPASVRSYSSE
jgi:hypothetical protein